MNGSIRVSAKTVDDAITEALIQLGVTSDRLEYEVIEKGSAGFLGIGMKQAVIEARRKPEPKEEKVEEPVVEEPVAEQPTQNEYVIGNKNTKAFHRPTCSRLPKPKNQVIFNNREEALAAGYDNPCDYCCP